MAFFLIPRVPNRSLTIPNNRHGSERKPAIRRVLHGECRGRVEAQGGWRPECPRGSERQHAIAARCASTKQQHAIAARCASTKLCFQASCYEARPLPNAWDRRLETSLEASSVPPAKTRGDSPDGICDSGEGASVELHLVRKIERRRLLCVCRSRNAFVGRRSGPESPRGRRSRQRRRRSRLPDFRRQRKGQPTGVEPDQRKRRQHEHGPHRAARPRHFEPAFRATLHRPPPLQTPPSSGSSRTAI